MRVVKRKRRSRRRRRSYRTGMRAISLRLVGVQAGEWPLHRVSALAVVLAGLVFLAYSGLSWGFYDYPIQVIGGSLIDENVIIGVCGLEYYHIFFVDSGAREARLEEMVEVKDASVSVEFPPRIVVWLEERKPVMEVVSGGKTFWVDEESVFMVPRRSVSGLFRLVDDSGVDIKPGDRLHKLVLKGAMELMKLGAAGGEVHYHPDEGFILLTPSGYPVYLGLDPSLMKARLEAYKRVKSYLESRGIKPSYIDVRSPSAPVYGVEASLP